MSFYYQKIIPNEVINEIEKLIYEGKTYREIKEIHKVSDGTITRIKQGKIKSDREIKDNIELVPVEQVDQLTKELMEARKVILEQNRKLADTNNFDPNSNVFDLLNNLEFIQKNYDDFLKTNFGSNLNKWNNKNFRKFKSKLEDEYNQKYNMLYKEKSDLLEDKEELVRQLKALECSQGKLNSFSGMNELKESVNSLEGRSDVYGDNKKVNFGRDLKNMELSFDK